MVHRTLVVIGQRHPLERLDGQRKAVPLLNFPNFEAFQQLMGALPMAPCGFLVHTVRCRSIPGDQRWPNAPNKPTRKFVREIRAL